MDRQTTAINMKHYKTIDTIPIWNFDKWRKTDDGRYILKLEGDEELPDISDKQSHELTVAAMEIYFEANELEVTMSSRNTYVFDMTRKLAVLQSNYDITKSILKLLELTGRDAEAEALLKNSGYSIREGKVIGSEQNRIFNQNQNKKVRITEIENELDAITKVTGKEESIESIQISLEKYNNREINLKTTSLKKWIILKNNLIKEIEKQQLKKK
jgi:hypothetical protein